MAQRKRRPSYPDDMIVLSRERAALLDTPTEILRVLKEEGYQELPHLNTVKLWVKDVPRDGDPTETWSLGAKDGGPEPDAESVLPVLAAVMTATGFETSSLTNWEAKVVTRIRFAAPHIDALRVWHLARGLIQAEMGNDTDRRDELHAVVASEMDPAPKRNVFRDGVASGFFSGTAAGTAIPGPSAPTYSGGAAIGEVRS